MGEIAAANAPPTAEKRLDDCAGPPRRPKGERFGAVEYRDAASGYSVRLVLRVRPGDPPLAEAGEVVGLRCKRIDAVYQIAFVLHGRRRCHEYPPGAVVRCEEEWPLPEQAVWQSSGSARGARMQA